MQNARRGTGRTEKNQDKKTLDRALHKRQLEQDELEVDPPGRFLGGNVLIPHFHFEFYLLTFGRSSSSMFVQA